MVVVTPNILNIPSLILWFENIWIRQVEQVDWSSSCTCVTTGKSQIHQSVNFWGAQKENGLERLKIGSHQTPCSESHKKQYNVFFGPKRRIRLSHIYCSRVCRLVLVLNWRCSSKRLKSKVFWKCFLIFVPVWTETTSTKNKLWQRWTEESVNIVFSDLN